MASSTRANFTGPPDVDDGRNRSDKDCLLVSPRHIVEQLSEVDALTGDAAHAGAGWPIKLASAAYESDTSGEMRDTAQADLKRAGFPDEDDGAGEPTFVRTSECYKMQETVWIQPFAILWQPDSFVRVKTEGAAWVKLPEENDVFTRDGASMDGQITYDPASLPADLRDIGSLASTAHGIFDCGAFHLKLLTAAPACIRVRFHPDGVCGLKDVVRFVNRVNATHRYSYRLCAAEDARDEVQLLGADFEPIQLVQAGSGLTTASYIGEGWKVGDRSHQYILYYVVMSPLGWSADCRRRPGGRGL